jgi:hypothetical protein
VFEPGGYGPHFGIGEPGDRVDHYAARIVAALGPLPALQLIDCIFGGLTGDRRITGPEAFSVHAMTTCARDHPAPGISV